MKKVEESRKLKIYGKSTENLRFMKYQITVRYNHISSHQFEENCGGIEEALRTTCDYLKGVMYSQHNSKAYMHIKDEQGNEKDYEYTLYLSAGKKVFHISQIIA